MDMQPFPGSIQGIHLSVWRRDQETIWMNCQMNGWSGKKIDGGQGKNESHDYTEKYIEMFFMLIFGGLVFVISLTFLHFHIPKD